MAESKLKSNIFTGFNHGEFSPSLSGRIDYSDFMYSVRKMSNFLPEPQGGIKKFYGTTKIHEFEADADVLMVPFDGLIYPCALIFYNGSLLYTWNDTVVDTGEKISLINKDSLSWQKINDIILFCNDSMFFQVSWTGSTFTISEPELSSMPMFPIAANIIGLDVPLYTSLTKGQVTLSVNTTTVGKTLIKLPQEFIDNPVGYNVMACNYLIDCRSQSHWAYNATDMLGLTSNGTPVVATLYRRRGGVDSVVVTSGNIGYWSKISSGSNSGWGYSTYINETLWYSSDDRASWQLRVDASNVLSSLSTAFEGEYVTDSSGVYVESISGHTSGDSYYIRVTKGDLVLAIDWATWSNEDISKQYILSGTRTDGSISRDGTVSDPITSTETGIPSAFKGFSSLLSANIKLYQESGDTDVWYEGKAVASGKIVSSGSHFYIAAGAGGTCGSVQPVHTEGSYSDGGVYWTYMNSGTAEGTIIDAGDTSVTVDFGSSYLPIITSSGTHQFDNFRFSLLYTEGLRPSQVFIWKNRLGLIFNTAYGSYYALSCTDDYFNFSEETAGEQLDTNSIVNLINGHNENNIKWVLAGNRLFLGSSSGEYVVHSANDYNIPTPTTCLISAISTIGGADVNPLRHREINMFVSKSYEELYSLGYNETSDDYVPDNIGYAGNHLFKEKISSMVSLNNSDRNVFFRTQENTVFGMNYVKEQELQGYFRLDLDGDVLAICAVSGQGNDEGYILVSRGEKLILEKYTNAETPYMLSTRTMSDYDGTSQIEIPEFANRDGWAVIGNHFIPLSFDSSGTVVKDSELKPFVASTTEDVNIYAWAANETTIYTKSEVPGEGEITYNADGTVYSYMSINFVGTKLRAWTFGSSYYTTSETPSVGDSLYESDGSIDSGWRIGAVSSDYSSITVVRVTTSDVAPAWNCPRDESNDTSVPVIIFGGYNYIVLEGEETEWARAVSGDTAFVQTNYVSFDVGLTMTCEMHSQPMVKQKSEGQQQKPVRLTLRLNESGAFSYGSSHDFDKYYDYDAWNVLSGQEYDSAKKLNTGDIMLPESFGYTQQGNVADGEYPNTTGVGVNIKATTPEPFNLLLMSMIYV